MVVVSSSAAIRRSRIPVRLLIDSSDVSTIRDSSSLVMIYPLPQDRPVAPAVHPEVVVAEREQTAALLRARRERAAVRPTPDVTVELEKPSDASFGVRAGVAVEVPLLSQNGGNVEAQEAEAARAASKVASARARLLADARAADARWAAARSRAEFSATEDVPGATHVRDLASAA